VSLLDRLRELGSRLRILETAPAAPATTVAKVATRAVTLSELTTEIRAEEVRALAELPAELSVDFERVYAAAGLVKPAHGWDAARLAQVLASEPLRGKPREIAQRALAQMLAVDRVPVEAVVRDVIARDQALDAYEGFARGKVEARAAARGRRIAEIDQEIAAREAERGRLAAETATERESWLAWQARKRAAERALADAVGYLVDRPVVTLDEPER
jgi:hypothetical protein